jgi:hypothetical protein
MNMLGTPFDHSTLQAPAPGTWSAGSSIPPVPSLTQTGSVGGAAWSGLATPWGSALSALPLPAVTELPTL